MDKSEKFVHRVWITREVIHIFVLNTMNYIVKIAGTANAIKPIASVNSSNTSI